MRSWIRRQRDNREFSEILASCLEEANTREAIDACLDRYPQHAAQLEPLLTTAISVRKAMVTPIREERRLAARRQFLQAAARRSSAASPHAAGRLAGRNGTPPVLLRPLWSAFAPAIVAALLFVVALIPIMSITSISALPGDWNYGFKRSTERVRLALALDPSDRLDLQLAFHQRRLGEIERLAADGRLNDPSLVQAFTNETSALVRTVSDNQQLGPSEALKVAQQAHAQAQTLADRVAPRASAAIRPVIADAVQESNQGQLRATEVAQSKEEILAATKPPTATPKANIQATATTTATASATAAATGTATATAVASASPTASPAPTATGTPLVPPAQAPLQPPTAPPRTNTPLVPAVTPSPTATALPPTPTPLVPPSQPQVSRQQFTAPLPAGETTSLVYIGPELPVPQALASIVGLYDAVFFTQPKQHGGQVFEWRPGQSDPLALLETGSQLSVRVKPGVAATLTYTIASSDTSR